MRTKFFLTLFTAFFCATAVMAQEPAAKQTVIVDVFSVKESINAKPQKITPDTDRSVAHRIMAEEKAKATYRSTVEGIRNKVIAAMNKTQRINVIDVKTESFFNQAAKDSSSEEALVSALDGADIRQSASKKYEAKFAITAHVNDIRAVRKTTDEGTVYYTGEISMSMKVINLEDGTVAHSKDFNYAGLTGQTGSTDGAAIDNTANYLVAAVPRFIDTAFPVTGKILDIISSKKGVATEVYVNIGAASGIKAKDKFNVFQIKTVAGREMRTEIGDLTVTEVGGDDISTCSVSKSCGEAIFTSVNNPDQVQIVIVSRPKSNIGGALGGFAKGMVN